MDSHLLYTFLSEIDNLQMFSLCMEFDALSLQDTGGSLLSTGGSSSSSTSQPSSSYSEGYLKASSSCYRSSYYLNSILCCKTNSPWSMSFIEQLRAPFIELPRLYLESISPQSYDIKMGFGFRFLPGQDRYLLQEWKLPACFEKLSFLRTSLGLSYIKEPISRDTVLPFSCSGAGLRYLVSDDDNTPKILVEVLTYLFGWYGRFLVLVCLGIGCTVWYAYAPGSIINPPRDGIFSPFDSYEPFFNMGHHVPGFHKIALVESHDVSESVASAFRNQRPFVEIEIPASGPVLKAVSLGVMVAFFISVGLLPIPINNETMIMNMIGKKDAFL